MSETVIFTPDLSSGTASLIVLNTNGEVTNCPIGSSITIGRATPDSRATLKLVSAIVSRNHGEIFDVGGKVYFRDNASTNGTFINGVKFGKDSPNGDTCILNDGDVIRIDRATLHNSHPEAILMIFMHQREERKWEELLLTPEMQRLDIGRNFRNSAIKSSDSAMSANHASFVRTQFGWSIADNGSTNGTFVNNQRIPSNQLIELYPMDVIRIASTTFILTRDSLKYDSGQSLSNDLNLNIHEQQTAQAKSLVENAGSLKVAIRERVVSEGLFKKKKLLGEINLSVNPGEMVLVLGSSGAGKTTFLHAVNAYEKADATILLGNTDVYKELDKIKNKIGYASQFATLTETDTVYNSIKDAAQMKLPNLSEAEQEEKINYVINRMGLIKERNSLVSKLSGGQKKRLIIAVQMISDPYLFLLDEPDSGLDGVTSCSLMKTLSDIAKEGRIVLIISHQPDRVRDKFDKIIVIAKSEERNCGELAFYGPVNDALRFFDTDAIESIVKRLNPKHLEGEARSDEYIARFKEYRRAMNI